MNRITGPMNASSAPGALTMAELELVVQDLALITPKRLVCVGSFLGYPRPAFYPNATGSGYESSTLLKPLSEFRDDFTVGVEQIRHGVQILPNRVQQ